MKNITIILYSILTSHPISDKIANILYKRIFMQAVNYSHARNNLKSIIDDVYDNNEAYIISSKNGKTVTMMSLDSYNRMQDQLKKDVKSSLKQLEECEAANKDEAFQRAKLAYDV